MKFTGKHFSTVLIVFTLFAASLGSGTGSVLAAGRDARVTPQGRHHAASPALAVMAQDDAPSLFDASPPPPPGFKPTTMAGSIRRRLASVKFNLLGGSGTAASAGTPIQRFKLNLFPNVSYTAVLDRSEPNASGGYTWQGHIEGSEYGTTQFTILNGQALGSVWVPGGYYYEIRYENGVHVINEVDTSKLPTKIAHPIMAAGPADVLPIQPPSQPAPPPSGTTVQVDMMLIYTDDVYAAMGNNSTAVQNEMQAYIDDMNAALDNSGVDTHINLVHTEMVTYNEGALNTAIGCLQVTNDGCLDNVPTLRTTYGADIVHMIVQNGEVVGGGIKCGVAYLMAGNAGAYSALAYGVDARDYRCGILSGHTVAHETGHNLGGKHDLFASPESSPYPNAPYPDNHALVHIGPNLSSSWYTVMAYDAECYSHFGQDCTAIQYYSTPDKSYNGYAMGVTNVSNFVRVLGLTSPTVALYKADVTPPTVPVLSTPANSSFTGGTPAFDWQDSAGGVVQYQIQISTDNTVATTQVDTTTSTSAYTPGASLGDGTFYWRVRAKDQANNYSAYSTVRSFTSDGTPPNTPDLATPADASTQFSHTPAFTYSDTSGDVALYQIQIDDNNDFSSTVVDTTTATGTYTPSSMPDKTYYWRVRARDAATNYSAWAGPWSVTINADAPTAPTLNTPANGSASSNTTPAFDWSDSTGNPTGYDFQLDDDSGFGSPEIDTSMATSDYTVGSAMSDGTYSWRVRAHDVDGLNSSWSTGTFTIDTLNPDVPSLTSPADTASVRGDPAYQWDAANGASAYVLEYDNDSGFGSVEYTSTEVTGTSLTPTGQPLGTWYWHVKSRDLAGNWSAFSTSRAVTVLPIIPAAPSLATPAEGGDVIVLTPSLTWGSVSGAATYQVQIDDASGFSSINQDSTGAATNYTTSALTLGTYYWRVRGINVHAESGDWSTPRSFDVVKPPAPANFAIYQVSTNTLVVNYTQILSAPIPSQYVIERSDNGTSGWAQVGMPPHENGQSGINYYDGNALACNTKYYYRMLADYGGGSYSEYTSVASATTMACTDMPVPILTKPLPGTLGTKAPALAWIGSKTATGYEIELTNLSTNNTQVFTSTTAGYKFPSALAFGSYSWRVRARDQASQWTSWSLPRTFGITGMTAPKPNVIVKAPAVVFAWGKLVGVSNWYLQVSTDSTFAGGLIVDNPAIPGATTKFPVTLPEFGKYYWRVSPDGGTTWMPAQSFIYTLALKPAPNGISTVGNVPFSWAGSKTATGWDITFASDRSCAGGDTYNLPAASTKHTPNPLSFGTYFWNLTLHDGTGDHILPCQRLDVTLMKAPVNGAELASPIPTLTWMPYKGAGAVFVQIATDDQFNNRFLDENSGGWLPGTAKSYKMPYALPRMTKYYWRISIDYGGTWMPTWTFTIQ